MVRLLATTALAMFIAQGSALAASTSSTNAKTAANQSTAQAAPSTLPQQIKDDLKEDGYTDVKVMPGSYVVSARDKRGNAVTMFIGPDSMTMVKAIDNSDQTTGSAAADDQADSSDNK